MPEANFPSTAKFHSFCSGCFPLEPKFRLGI